MPELARITDTLEDANGFPVTGKIVITPSGSFIAADGTAVSAAPFTYQIEGGVIDLQLAPTVGAEPETTYQADYTLSGVQYTETWNVGREADGPYTLSEVRGTG